MAILHKWLGFHIVMIFISAALSYDIDSRSFKILNGSDTLAVYNCDTRDVYDTECDQRFLVYRGAAKIPSAGIKGYVTDEPQFACSKVDPPNNVSIGWAALVKLNDNDTCDCSRVEQKLLQVQQAGYQMALLVYVSDCPREDETVQLQSDTNVTINISAVTVYLKLADRLIRYAVPTTESDKAVQVVVRVHYEEDYTQIILIIGGTMLGIVIFTIAFTALIVYMDRRQRRCMQAGNRYVSLPQPVQTRQHTNTPKVSDNNKAQLTKSEDKHENIPLQKMKRNHKINKYGGVVENTSASVNSTPQDQQTNGNNNYTM
ncbi:uncharacterized protein [Dysidea avara]|uniref:uncharacterized protein n=1 Tax=Dysidea avara TaxID=196820 RepID=UPI003320DDCF